MNAKWRTRTLKLLFGATLVCVVLSASGELAGLLSSFLTICCHALQIALPSKLLAHLGTFARSIVGLVVLAGLIRSGCVLWRSYTFARQVQVGAVPPVGRLADLCREVGISRNVVMLPTPTPLAFCYGFFRPHIGVSTGLVALLSKAELKAVLLHEAHHCRHYDPLRTLLLEVLVSFLFFLPVVAEGRAHLVTAAELAADRYAIRHAGRHSLAGALHKLLASAPAPQPYAAVMFTGQNAVAVRIAYLLGEAPVTPPLPGRSIARSSLFLLVTCLLLQLALL